MNNFLIRDEITCKGKIVEYLKKEKICSVVPNIDAIDISGALLASNEWRNYCKELMPSNSIWRVALLRPDSYGAQIRAKESTVWRGAVDMLNLRIQERTERIFDLGKELDIKVQIRYYESVPVTRYMRLEHCFLESYYPSDCTGANTPLYVLTEGSVLQKRVEKEFSTLWETLI